MSASTDSWMPAQGRHKVNVGRSLGRALKARRARGSSPPATPAKRSALPDTDYYSFRYNFKPHTIDKSKQGTITTVNGKDSTSVRVEHPSVQDGERHIFRGTEHVAKEWDCVLIYDELTGTYTLEKLDSYLNLTHERKTASVPQSHSSQALESNGSPGIDSKYEAELERDFRGTAEDDAAGATDLKEIIPLDIPSQIHTSRQEDTHISQRKPSCSVAKTPLKARTQHPVPTSHGSQQVKPAAEAATKAKKQKKNPELTPVVCDADEEVLQFGQPAKPARAAPHVGGLALPGTSSSFAAPHYNLDQSVAPAPHIAAVDDVSESDGEWDEVPPAAMNVDDGFGDQDDGQGEEIDINAFEKEMDEQLLRNEGDEDYPPVSTTSSGEALRSQPVDGSDSDSYTSSASE